MHPPVHQTLSSTAFLAPSINVVHPKFNHNAIDYFECRVHEPIVIDLESDYQESEVDSDTELKNFWRFKDNLLSLKSEDYLRYQSHEYYMQNRDFLHIKILRRSHTKKRLTCPHEIASAKNELKNIHSHYKVKDNLIKWAQRERDESTSSKREKRNKFGRLFYTKDLLTSSPT